MMNLRADHFTHVFKRLLLALGFCSAVGTSAVDAADKGIATGSGAVTTEARALVKVSDAWIRFTVPGQSGTGGFMQLTSSQPLTLIGFATDIASTAELHEMSMEANVMRMRSIKELALPPGQAVSLRSSGHHLMLMGLKQQLKAGDAVSVTLLLKAEDGKVIRQLVVVPVLASAPAKTGVGMAGHQGMDHQTMDHGAAIKSQGF
jgi:copper(I)-binding protein